MAEWYQQSAQQALSAFRADPERGLAAQEALARLARDGPNALPEGKRLRWWQLALRQFKSPLVYILVIAAGITAWIGYVEWRKDAALGESPERALEQWVDTIIILLAVAVNVGVGFFQEFHAGNIFEALKRIVTVRARVIRNGAVREVDSRELVVGDVILLSAGARVPADARLLSARNLKTNEALLTGESSAVGKNIERISKEASVGDRANTVFMGTTVERGEGKAVVTATGEETEIGRIAELTHRAGEGESTPLQERVAHLGRFLAIFVTVAALLIFIVGLFQDRDPADIFVVAVAVAVAGIPEGLPAALSVVLAVSMKRILRRKGLVKQLVAAETLGSASVVCVDKTGTLTEGVMKLEELVLARDEKRAMRALALANEAVLVEEAGKRAPSGESTDRAKLQAYLDAGGDLKRELFAYPRTVLLPFDPNRGYLASFHADAASPGTTVLFVTGSPETLLLRATRFAGQRGETAFSKQRAQEIQKTYEERASRGYRMIAIGWRTMPDSGRDLSRLSDEELDGLVRELTFGGLAAIRDPIREDVRETVRATREAGIRVVMVTGDHRLTAKAIGRELGFRADDAAVVDGQVLDEMSDEELKGRIGQIDIFARVNPRHKMRIVDAWQARGESVAMTGDGVNDAPALKAADIGIALGSATEVTKEAAEIVLLDDGFSTIVAAIREGRIAFDNIRKVVVFLLAGSFTELIIILSSLVLHVAFLPVTAAQILWVNLVEDGPPNFALAFEPGEPGIMRRRPFRRGAPIFDGEAKVLVFIVGILTDLLLLAVFLGLVHFTDWSAEHIQTFIFAALGTDALFYVFALKSFSRPIWHTNPLSNRYLLIAVAIGFTMMFLGVYAPPLNTLLHTVPLSLFEMLAVVGMGAVNILLIEIVKAVYRHRFSGTRTEALEAR